MPKQSKTPAVQFEVLVRISDGATGAHEVGTILDYDALAAYVSDENIAALVAAGHLREVEQDG